MFITEVKIKNYRNFTDFKCNLKQFTLIIGENNVGKTNLLNALGLIFSHDYSSQRNRQLSIDDVNYSVVKEFKTRVLEAINGTIKPDEVNFPEVIIQITLEDFNEEQKSVVLNWYLDDKYDKVQLTYLFYPNQVALSSMKWYENLQDRRQKGDSITEDMIDFPVENYKYMIYGGRDKSKAFDSYSLNLLKIEFLDALRDAKKELVWQNDYRLLNKVLTSKLSNKALSKELLESIEKLNESIKKDSLVSDLVNEVQEKLKSISYEDEDCSLEYVFNDINNKDIFKRLCLRYGIEPISIERNGLGRNNLLYIALILSQLEYREGYENQPYYRLIAIEEPEAHLHPHLQKHLAYQLDKQICECFASTNCKNGKVCDSKCKLRQIVVTSHSTHITSHLCLENIMVLFNNNGIVDSHYVLQGIDPKIHSKSIYYLSKFLDATNTTMFFSRRIILVEGIAEEILIPLFYRMVCGKTLESKGITLINVRSIAFKHFLEIIKSGYFIKCVVFTDSDIVNGYSQNVTKLKSDYETNSNGIISIAVSALTTFEKDVIESNKTGISKDTLLAALRAIHPDLTKSYTDSNSGDLDVEKCFEIIYCKEKKRDSKSDFAFELLNQIVSDSSSGFSVPQYIIEGFKFING